MLKPIANGCEINYIPAQITGPIVLYQVQSPRKLGTYVVFNFFFICKFSTSTGFTPNYRNGNNNERKNITHTKNKCTTSRKQVTVTTYYLKIDFLISPHFINFILNQTKMCKLYFILLKLSILMESLILNII